VPVALDDEGVVNNEFSHLRIADGTR